MEMIQYSISQNKINFPFFFFLELLIYAIIFYDERVSLFMNK